MSKTPGQAAYEAWGDANTLAPEVLPWEHLPEEYAQRWERVAQAAVEASPVRRDYGRLFGNVAKLADDPKMPKVVRVVLAEILKAERQ